MRYAILILLTCVLVVGAQSPFRTQGSHEPIIGCHFDTDTGEFLIPSNNEVFVGTIQGGAAWVSGRWKTGLFFDKSGSTDWVLFNESYQVDITTNLIVACWVKLDSADYAGLVSKWANGEIDRSWMLNISGAGEGFTYNFYVANGSASSLLIAAGITTTGKWQHIAGSYSSTTGWARIYVDGEPISQTNFGIQLNISNSPVRIGTLRGSGIWNAPDGIMDEVVIIDNGEKVPTDGDIKEIYNSGSPFHGN